MTGGTRRAILVVRPVACVLHGDLVFVVPLTLQRTTSAGAELLLLLLEIVLVVLMGRRPYIAIATTTVLARLMLVGITALALVMLATIPTIFMRFTGESLSLSIIIMRFRLLLPPLIQKVVITHITAIIQSVAFHVFYS